jgi:uncharacterized protein (UPF0548 family)
MGRISRSNLRKIAREAESFEPTYEDIGATLHGGDLPPDFRHDRYELELPTRADGFARAVEGLRSWAPHVGAGLTVEPDRLPPVGSTVAVAAPVGPLTAIAVCRVVAVVDEPDRYGFAYGTLPGHPERGEEAFVVEHADSRLVFRIVAFSKPAEVLARLGGPVTRRIQRTTTTRYLQGLADFITASI